MSTISKSKIIFCISVVAISGCNNKSFSTSLYDGVDGYQYTDINNEDEYWYDSGESLPIGINYHDTNLLDSLCAGDIIYEETGGFGITGHIAIVEGIFFSDTFSQYYVRVIEAISVGVSRSILTPQRFETKIDTAFRIKNADKQIIEDAMSYVVSQLGKPYELALWKNADSDNPDWYCSELIWAAFYHQGILLDSDDNNNRGSIVFPNEIIQSELLSKIDIDNHRG